jgi:hypothetical protein
MYGDAVDIANPEAYNSNVSIAEDTWYEMYVIAQINLPGATVLDGVIDQLRKLICVHVDWR